MSDDTKRNDCGHPRLWAPWRMEYIEGIDNKDTGGCIFCDKPNEDTDRENLILYRGTTCFIIMNRFPYNNGHLLIVPYHHTSELGTLDSAARLELFDLSDLAVRAIRNTMRPDGFNLGANLGRTAGAGIADHIHLHLVPRWNGDTNFMPVIGSTKVISESLESTYDKLHAEFARLVTVDGTTDQ
jgi:ATP adenylyltransferase